MPTRRKSACVSMIVLIGAHFVTVWPAEAQTEIVRWVFPAAGDISSAGLPVIVMRSSLGQALAGGSGGGNVSIVSGFWSGGACPAWCGGSDSEWECREGKSIVPLTTLLAALKAALLEHEPGMEHIIMMRPGSYNEPMTIADRVELRGSRGTVVIGK